MALFFWAERNWKRILTGGHKMGAAKGTAGKHITINKIVRTFPDPRIRISVVNAIELSSNARM